MTDQHNDTCGFKEKGGRLRNISCKLDKNKSIKLENKKEQKKTIPWAQTTVNRRLGLFYALSGHWD